MHHMIPGVVAAAMLAMSGCGHWVSKRESLNTAMSPGLSARADATPVWRATPAPPTRIPREGILLPDLHHEDVIYRYDSRSGIDLDTRRERAAYLGQLAVAVTSMRHDLIKLSALANRKGAVGRTAFDPKLRDFNLSVRLIERYLHELRGADDAQWSSIREKIDVQLDDARNAVREANEDLRRVHDAGHLLVSATPHIEDLDIR